MSDDELKGCPHCGNHARFQAVPDGDPTGFGGRHYLECMNKRCGASTGLSPAGLTTDQAHEYLRLRWNARVDNSAPHRSEVPAFPVALRKQWSGSEVQDWINANWHAPAEAA